MKTMLRFMLLIVFAAVQLGAMPQAVFAQSSDCLGVISPECPSGSSNGVNALAGAFFHMAYSTSLHGGYVAHGVGMRNTGYGTISVSDIPSGSAVVKAYLYWAVLGPSNLPGYYYYKGKINNKSISGTLIGKSSEPYWLGGSNNFIWGYRADVTSYVVKGGNGNYNLSGFASSLTGGEDPWKSSAGAPLLEGASLVIVFSNALYPVTTVKIMNGVTSTMESELHLNVAGINAYGLPGRAYTTFIGADGQNNAEQPPTRLFSDSLPVYWNGSDPNGAGRDYSSGNLWDTTTVDLHSLVQTPEPDFYFSVGGGPDALTWIAQVFSYSSGNVDTDGDGLKDSWELNGVNGVDLPGYGADPLHKDLFIEADYMTLEIGGTMLPDKAHLDDIVNVFDSAPVKNPDGTYGVHIHIDTGGAAYGAASETYPQYDLGGGGSVPYTTYLGTSDPGSCQNYSWDGFQAYKDAYMSSSRQGLFHYMIFAYDLSVGCGTVSGISRNNAVDSEFVKGAQDFIVSVGGWTSHGSMDQREGTFIHELGHNLGLRHGGSDHKNYKPNYLSVMNYSFQMSGVYRDGAWGHYDYSRFLLPSLSETTLYEVKGLGSKAANYGTRWWCGSDWLYSYAANSYIDWNCNSTYETTAKSADINGDGGKNTLGTQNNWASITFKGGGAIGAGVSNGLSVHPMMVSPRVNELTEEEYLARGGDAGK